MSFALTEDQRMLRDNARQFFEQRSPLPRVRTLRDGGDALGFDPKLYAEMAGLGFLAIPFAEEHGGLGLGMAEAVLVAEAMGRRLAPEPFLSAVMFAGQLLHLSGSDAQKAAWLPAIAAGEKRLSVAYYEPRMRYELGAIACEAKRSSEGFVLNGVKAQVFDAPGADGFIVLARTGSKAPDLNGLSAFLVPAAAAGLSVQSQHMVDHRRAGLLELKEVAVPEEALVGAVDMGIFALLGAMDRVTVALCGEMLGGMTAAFELTLDYLKERKQFGKYIGSFQALQHRAVDMFMAIELSRTAMMHAARQLDSNDFGAAQAVSMAKARCNDAYTLVANESVQMFAGIGMTDEHDIGFFMKRARVSEMAFGDSAFHRDRWGTLAGF